MECATCLTTSEEGSNIEYYETTGEWLCELCIECEKVIEEVDSLGGFNSFVDRVGEDSV